ncbi:MAG: hypothetical protein KDD38_03360 [Bdellovibrionales bacterium]|nr:hypothetical protein [Bdellovibrionales bacterium]
MKYVLSLLMLAAASSSFAATNHCSEWKRVHGTTCVFNGDTAFRWVRTCTDSARICRPPDYNRTPCDSENICVDTKINPNLMKSICTDWVRSNGVTCRSDRGRGTSKHWIRSCQQAWIATTACQDTPPSNSDFGMYP